MVVVRELRERVVATYEIEIISACDSKVATVGPGRTVTSRERVITKVVIAHQRLHRVHVNHLKHGWNASNTHT